MIEPLSPLQAAAVRPFGSMIEPLLSLALPVTIRQRVAKKPGWASAARRGEEARERTRSRRHVRHRALRMGTFPERLPRHPVVRWRGRFLSLECSARNGIASPDILIKRLRLFILIKFQPISFCFREGLSVSKILKLLLVFLCLPLAAHSQTASLVTDLGRRVLEESPSYPGSFFSLRGKVFFTADGASTSSELWVSDGTAAGTELLADVCPGVCRSNPEILGSSGEGIFWIAEALPQRLLWWSDGTRAGTRALRREDLRPLSPNYGGSVTLAGGILYFKGCFGDQDCTLWRSDGTEAGTRPVATADRWRDNSVGGLQAVGSTVFFFASEDFSEPGLWRTDGTEAGTRQVKKLEVSPRLTAAAADRFFFVASTRDGEGEELWTSDGTETGTRRLVSFPEDESSPFDIPWLKPIGGRVYFIANDVLHGWEVWRSDGTPEGTERVTSFGFSDPFGRSFSPWQLEEVGSRVVFLATNGLEDVKLWTATGSGQPMAALAEVCPESFGSCTRVYDSWRLVKAGGRVVFRGSDAGHGDEIWSTDGTASGTRRLSDVCPGPCSGAAEPVASGSSAWFSMITRQGDPRRELWKSDGTPAGTRRFVRLDTAWFWGELTLATLGNKVFFSAGDEQHGVEPWVSDGTPEGTGLVEDISRIGPSSYPEDFAVLGDTLFFNACPALFETVLYKSGGTPETTAAVFNSGPLEPCGLLGKPVAAIGKIFFERSGQLWATDGTPGNTVRVTQIDAENSQSLIPVRVEHQGRLYFPVRNQETVEIWRSDGTPGGTEKVLEIAEIRGIFHMASLGSHLYFTATDDSDDLSPWRSDGTPAGTLRLTDTEISSDENKDPQFIRLGNAVLFAGDELWRTNGTPQGTARVRDLSERYIDAGITDFTIFEGALYFFAHTLEDQRALWRSDGTSTGTVVVKPLIDLGVSDSDPRHLTVFAGRLFFAAEDGVHGRELWTSDGTATGTTLVRDIHPGASSWPSDLVVAGGKLFFTADDGLNGQELWESDGTAAGTRLRQDIAPGAASSSPRELTVAGSRLFFSADDGETGRELWALPLEGAGGCQPSATVLCLAGGRFHVEVFWQDFEDRTGPGRATALTADTGYFWFFDPENVEVVVKVLDGQGVNGHHWVFYGALSSVEYSITVTDTVTGVSRRYFNPKGRLGSVGHTEAFGPRGAISRLAAGAEAPPPAVTEGSAKAGPCVESATRLCLNNGRFAVEAAWKDFSGNTGTGKAVRLTGDTGYFWFFNDGNVELVLKVLDGRPVNNKFWVFYGALSSVEYTITVTDTETGTVKTYKNPSGRLGSVGDTGAF
jgi:ELWxxDGT repeat protein